MPKTARTQEPDHSNGYARLACEKMSAGDNAACIKSSVLESLMEEYYPRTWFVCVEMAYGWLVSYVWMYLTDRHIHIRLYMHNADLEYYTCNEQTGELKPIINPAWFK